MKYIVDGYNLLFYLSDAIHLAKERQNLLELVNKFVKKAKLDLVVVFDSTYSKEDFQRSHYDALEVQFTAYKKTADDQIIHLVETKKPQDKITVITSDKTLKRHVEDLGAKTILVPLFYQWLLKRSEGKKVKKSLVPKEPFIPLLPPKAGTKEWYLSKFEGQTLQEPPPIKETAPLQDSELERYLKIFQERFKSP